MQHLNGLQLIAKQAPEYLLLLGSNGIDHTLIHSVEPFSKVSALSGEEALQYGIMRAYAAMLPYVLQETPLSVTLLSIIHTHIYSGTSHVAEDNLGKLRGFGVWGGDLFSTYKLYQTIVSHAGMHELLNAQERGFCHCETAYQKPLHTTMDIEKQLASPPGYFCVSGYRAGFSWFDLNSLQDKIEQQQKLLLSHHQGVSILTQTEQHKLALEIQSILQRWQVQFEKALHQIFSVFQQNIAQCLDTEHAILREIVHFIKELLFIHPFFQGNLRTIGIVFCNTLLMRYGFYPAIIEDPFAWRGFSTDEMVTKIQQGIQSFHVQVMQVTQHAEPQDLHTKPHYAQQLVVPFQSALLGLSLSAVNVLE